MSCEFYHSKKSGTFPTTSVDWVEPINFCLCTEFPPDLVLAWLKFKDGNVTSERFRLASPNFCTQFVIDIYILLSWKGLPLCASLSTRLPPAHFLTLYNLSFICAIPGISLMTVFYCLTNPVFFGFFFFDLQLSTILKMEIIIFLLNISYGFGYF